MKRLALVASFCGIAITQMMAQNINGEVSGSAFIPCIIQKKQ